MTQWVTMNGAAIECRAVVGDERTSSGSETDVDRRSKICTTYVVIKVAIYRCHNRASVGTSDL